MSLIFLLLIPIVANPSTKPESVLLTTSDETIGQLLRYMGWVKENLSREKTFRGIIIGDSYDKKFDFALSGIQDNTINEKIKFFKHPFSDENKPVLLKAN